MLLFDGLGGNSHSLPGALRALHDLPENHAFFETFCGALDESLDQLGPTALAGVLPAGLPLRTWLGTPAAFPPDALQNSVVAGVCVFAYQVCHLQPFRHDPGGVAAALGHSIGLQAAIVAGLGLRRMDEFLTVVADCVKLLVAVLGRGHEVAARDSAGQGPVSRYLAGDERVRPGPMASLTGMTRDEVRAVVHRYNEDGRRTLSLGLANSPTVHVLTGRTTELLDFYFSHTSVFARAAATWTFLPHTIPFHSARLGPAVERVRADLDVIGHLPSPDRLRIPVYAADAARNLQDSADLTDEFLTQVLVRPIEWELAALHAINDARIERVVDCGPGPGARRFTRECLRGRGRALRFESIQQFSRAVR